MKTPSKDAVDPAKMDMRHYWSYARITSRIRSVHGAEIAGKCRYRLMQFFTRLVALKGESTLTFEGSNFTPDDVYGIGDGRYLNQARAMEVMALAVASAKEELQSEKKWANMSELQDTLGIGSTKAKKILAALAGIKENSTESTLSAYGITIPRADLKIDTEDPRHTRYYIARKQLEHIKPGYDDDAAVRAEADRRTCWRDRQNTGQSGDKSNSRA